MFATPIVDAGCFRDFRFWIAMGLGPLVWLLLIGVFHQPVTFGSALSAMSLVSLIVLYPLVEELLFRGVVQGWLLTKNFAVVSYWGVSVANILTSLVFTALHFFTQAPTWAALVFLPSLVFGWARDRYQALTASIVLHVFYNAGFILLFA